MDNIYDYVRWTGGFSFEEKPFCDADALAFAVLAYYDYDPDGRLASGSLTLKETCRRMREERGTLPPFVAPTAEDADSFIEAAADSRRFGSLLLKSYTQKLDLKKAVQFAAVTFECPGDFSFTAFRGTDETLAGWKEDFMISFTRTEAQELAVAYAKENIAPGIRNFIGGHSKGANLALYAAAHLPDELWQSVEQVYVLDGPGFCPEVMDTSLIERVDHRATRIIPKFCIIGKLFEPRIRHTVIVDSSQEGFIQHELFTWGIAYGELIAVPENDPKAVEINRTIDRWIKNVSQKERRVFVDELFGALSADGAVTVTDVMKNGIGGIENILVGILGSSRTTRRTMASLPAQAAFGNVFRNIRRIGFVKWFDECQVLKCLILIGAGIFFIAASEKVLEFTAMVFFLALAAAELIFTVKRLYQEKWDLTKIKERIYLLVILTAICIVIVVKENALFMIGSILYGVFAITLAFRQLAKATRKDGDLTVRVIHIIETILLFISGVCLLIIPFSSIYGYTLFVGILLIADGAARFIYRVYPFFKKPAQKRERGHRRSQAGERRRERGEARERRRGRSRGRFQ